MSFNDLTIEEYGSMSIVVQGDTRKYKEDLKKLGGKYNGRLSSGPGWIFPKTSQSDLKSFINNGKRLVTEEEAKEGEERSKKNAEEWKQKETQEKKYMTPDSDVKSYGSTPSLTEYSILMSLVKNMDIKMNRLENAMSLLLSDEQKEQLVVLMKPNEKKSVLKKSVLKRSVLKKVESDVESDSEEDVQIPKKRLLR
jgi:hypothetical protein